MRGGENKTQEVPAWIKENVYRTLQAKLSHLRRHLLGDYSFRAASIKS